MAKQDSGCANGVKQQRRSSPCKPYLAFSIDSILGRKDEENEETLNPRQVIHGKEAFSSTRREREEEHKAPTEASSMNSTKITDLPWLAYTRYSPPKLPSEYISFVHLKLFRNCSCLMLGRTDETKSGIVFHSHFSCGL